MVRIPKSSSTFPLSWTLSALTQRSAAPPINARMPTVQGDAGPRADEEHGMTGTPPTAEMGTTIGMKLGGWG